MGLSAIAAESGLNAVMAEAVPCCSVFFRVLTTLYLTPLYDPEAPDTLLSASGR